MTFAFPFSSFCTDMTTSMTFSGTLKVWRYVPVLRACSWVGKGISSLLMTRHHFCYFIHDFDDVRGIGYLRMTSMIFVSLMLEVM